MAENKRFFLDWEGVKTLWGKISSTFATKEAVNSAVEEINGSINDLSSNIAGVAGDLQALDTQINNRIDGVEGVIGTFAPREYQTYTDAVNGSSELTAGTIINILTDSKLLDADGNPVENEDGESPVYKAGLYMVVDPAKGTIEKISTASGSGVGANVEELALSVQKLDAAAVKGATIVDESGSILSEVEKTDSGKLLIKVDNEFKANSESVNALSHRAAAAMFGTLAEQITKLPKFSISVVEELPTTEISTTTIYLVKNSNESSNNLFTEYIYVTTGTTGEWEKLGEQTLVIDNYVTKDFLETQINAALTNVVKTSDLSAAITEAKGEVLETVKDTYVSKTDADKFIDTDKLNSALESYYTKDEADAAFLTQATADTLYVKPADIEGFTTEEAILASIQSGLIGETISVTTEQINSLTIE